MKTTNIFTPIRRLQQTIQFHNIVLQNRKHNHRQKSNTIMSAVLISPIRRPCSIIVQKQLSAIPGCQARLSTKTSPKDDDLVRRKMIEKIIRVDHAGEMGASYIYQGKIFKPSILLTMTIIDFDCH